MLRLWLLLLLVAVQALGGSTDSSPCSACSSKKGGCANDHACARSVLKLAGCALLQQFAWHCDKPFVLSQQ